MGLIYSRMVVGAHLDGGAHLFGAHLESSVYSRMEPTFQGWWVGLIYSRMVGGGCGSLYQGWQVGLI